MQTHQGQAEAVAAVYRELEAMHGGREWHWWPNVAPFEVAVGAILVQNTAWANVEHALVNLRQANALTPAAMAQLSVEALETLIRPSGQYRQKARKLQALLGLADLHGGFDCLLALPSAALREALLDTWGIGPETADVIVLYAAEQPSFVIDAYTIRLFSRLGLGPGGVGYATWQAWFTDALEAAPEIFARYHALIVLHCKFLCRKLRPACGACTLAPRCPSALIPAPLSDA